MSHAAATRNGKYLVTCESSCLLLWNLEATAATTAALLLKEFLPEVVQLLLWHDDRRLFVVTEENPSAAFSRLELIKGSVSRKLRPMLLYIIQKLLIKPLSAYHYHKVLLKGYAAIYV